MPLPVAYRRTVPSGVDNNRIIYILGQIFVVFLISWFDTWYTKINNTRGMSLTCHFVLRKLYTGHFIGASYQISINLAKWFLRKKKLIGQSQTRTAYGDHISCMIGMKYGNFAQDLPCIIPIK